MRESVKSCFQVRLEDFFIIYTKQIKEMLNWVGDMLRLPKVNQRKGERGNIC